MKPQDALKKIFWQFGVVVLQEKRLMAILADFKAFDEYPALKQVFKGISDGGYAKEICSLIISGDTKKLQSYAGDVKNSLVSDQNFRKELADYAVDCILYALGRKRALSELSYHGFDPFNPDKQAELSQLTTSELSVLGEKYYYGRGVSQDYKEAAKYFLKTAEQGYADAQYKLGRMYEYGYGVGSDVIEAVEWYEKAALQGHSDAQYSLGCLYDDFFEDVKALYWYEKSAEQGNSAAQYRLGNAYESGDVVERDFIKAMECYEKAAELGNADAQYRLGFIYGFGGDYDKSMEWFGKAAEQGDAAAQYRLGYAYECGYGVERDNTKAMEWYEKAAENGDTDAQSRLGRIYELNGDYDKARLWYEKAAEQGSAVAKSRLNGLYQNNVNDL